MQAAAFHVMVYHLVSTPCTDDAAHTSAVDLISGSYIFLHSGVGMIAVY